MRRYLKVLNSWEKIIFFDKSFGRQACAKANYHSNEFRDDTMKQKRAFT